ncbi:caspase family protein [Lewinella sp. IMCC34183]|uniref:caspase family protein n=1 Tax=Lewinella sp. IMCC34183 TaxID=2248762 RepID=UPI000E2386ED|nr:caspase family protein [Lewinella sp. IMCC34183]
MLKFLFLPLLLICTTALSAQGRCQRGNCYTGEGVLRFADGALYTGTFREGQFNGTGTLTYPDGSVYSGSFRAQLQSGPGKLIDASGNRYEGMWREGRRHGRGKVIYTDGGEIVGTWVDDVLDGEVAYTFANENYYVGTLRENALDGFGTMDYANGDRYVGFWSANRPNGRGRMTYADGTAYQGEWLAGEPRVDWATLGFVGNTADLVNCNEGCPDGDSRYTYSDGTTFFGTTRDGSPDGRGTVMFPNGNSYHGAFSNHRPNGLGVMQYPSGLIEGGLWQDGQLARPMYTAQGNAPVAATAEYDPEVKVWAVVVGCAYYQHMKTLRYTDDDAYQFYAFLKSIEGGALTDEQVKVLIDEDATHENILAALHDTYRKADENDVILFYFSGHGLPGSFLPVDYDGERNALAHADVHAALAESRSRHKVVIADACHSGSLAARGVGGNTGMLTDYYSALTNAQASTALMMSSRGEEISMEDGGLRSGVFSHYLIRGMKGEADANKDGMVSIEELFTYVHREVRGYTGNLQTPTLTGNYDRNMPVSVTRAR